MTKSLPVQADINLLKKQAKKLLRQYRSGSSDALTTINTLHPKSESFRGLRDAQLVVARSYGFKGWAELSDAVAKTRTDKEKLLYCDFCGKSQYEVSKLIAGPDVFICETCADLCIGIIVEENEEAKPGEMPVPHDMPHLESAIQKAQEFHIPRKNSRPKEDSRSKENPSDDDNLTVAEVYENALEGGFSGVILARYRGDIVFNEAAGFANKGQKILNTLDTVFYIGSKAH